MSKLFYIPNFSKYRITKEGNIFLDTSGEVVYQNNSLKPLPVLEDDNGEMRQLTRVDIASAYYGYLENSRVTLELGSGDYSSKSVRYVIDTIEPINSYAIKINGNTFIQIENASRYYVSERGVIYSDVIKDFKLLNLSKKYLIVSITSNDGVTRDRYIHHLVYEAFVGPRTKGMVIDHIDENRWNNYHVNLQEISYQENTIRSNQNISDSYLDLHYRCWTDDILDWMCQQMVYHNRSGSQICDLLRLDKERDRSKVISLLFSLRKGGQRSVSSKYDFSNYDAEALRIASNQRYPLPVYRAIDYFIDEGKTNVEIAKILGMPRQTVNMHRVRRKRSKEGSETIESIA